MEFFNTIGHSQPFPNRSGRVCSTLETGHPAAPPSKIPAPLRSYRLPATLEHRRLLRKTQAMATHRHSLQQARKNLHGLRQNRKYHALDQIIKSSLQSKGFRYLTYRLHKTHAFVSSNHCGYLWTMRCEPRLTPQVSEVIPSAPSRRLQRGINFHDRAIRKNRRAVKKDSRFVNFRRILLYYPFVYDEMH